MNIRSDLSVDLKMKIHDILYRKMQKLLDQYNPCGKKLMADLSTGCMIYEDISKCCDHGNCAHLTYTGCKTKSLQCKLHLCWEARSVFAEKHPKIAKRWKLWKHTAVRLDMSQPWESQQETYNRLSNGR